MFYENGKYHFTHRSFQEYFCALYFSKQKDKNLKRIGDFFENKNRRHYSDQTFNMLYDMIPEKIEEYIFSPFLQSLFEMCDAENGYWTFLEKLYPMILSRTVDKFLTRKRTLKKSQQWSHRTVDVSPSEEAYRLLNKSGDCSNSL